MRVAYVTDEYPPCRQCGGIGSYVANITQLLVDHGHEVHVFCQKDGISKPTAGQIIHPVTAWDLPTSILRYAYYRSLGRVVGAVQSRVRWGVSVGRAIRRVEQDSGRLFDAVEIPEAGGFAGLIKLGGVRSPIVVRMHSGERMLRRHSGVSWTCASWLIALLERWSIRHADLVTAPSSAIIEETRLDLGISQKSRVLTYPNPLAQLDVAAGGDDSVRDPFLMLTVGRLCIIKGTDLALDAFQLLCDEVPRLRLVMVGRNLGMSAIDARLQSLERRTSRVVCTGELSALEVENWMAKAGIVIVASRFESYSLVTVEALRAGCLVIAARVGALPEIITHGANGLLFEPGSVQDLARAVTWALEHSDRCEQLRLAGQAWVREQLAPERLLRSITDAYALAGESSGWRDLERCEAGGKE